jgi:GNAT superfamily N-acetyltransferase
MIAPLQPITFDHGDITITTDKSLMIASDIYRWLSQEAYWCKCIPYDTFSRSFDNSYCIGALHNGRQVGYARLITDYATFAYLADVFVLEEYRGRGISRVMMQTLFDIDWVKGLRAIRLATIGTHWLYEKFGFTGSKHPERLMELVRPEIYTTAS